MAPGGSDAELGDAGRRSGKRQRKRYSSYLRLPTFLKSSRARAAAPPVQDGGVAEDSPLPTHLVVMVNGIVGRPFPLFIFFFFFFGAAFTELKHRKSCNTRQRHLPIAMLELVTAKTVLSDTDMGSIKCAANWKYAAKQFVKKHPVDIMVHCSESNYGTLTFHGVDVMGERLAKEVISIVASKPFLQKISFVGHSLGGLIARYAIGILYEKTVPKCILEEHGACEYHPVGAKSVDEKIKGKIAGLEPMNFITFATPHLGSRLHKQIPLFHGSYKLEKMAYRTCWIFRRSGKHLFLKDHDNGKLPLLVQMVSDCGDLRFISKCVFMLQRQDFMINSQYPHIIYVEKPTTVDVPQMNFPATTKELKTISDMEDAMIDGLNRVPWERVDVSFRGSKQRFFAHSTIQVKTYMINSDGSDVIFHMIDNFRL
ncbi:hypothetical protein ZIOFF_069023 [Zingiber officinale]|uniref:DUF676 domain-containing protein n=1 Tax=Zingiber officinale TaxID=94328 RepID=A0A8J5CD57_ZINOF|nr:hypothetical protein ZIOFF_069023 [Zingiber officinale]